MGTPKRRSPENREEGRRLARRLAVTLQALDCTAAATALPLALVGDGAAAIRLIETAPPDLRGVCAVVVHLGNVPAAVMRLVLEAVAFRDHDVLIEAVPNAGRLIGICCHAGTQAPADVPETFQAWRGVRGMGIKRGAKGRVWTLDRAAACWAATCDNAEGQYPLLLTATVRRQDVGLRIGDGLLLTYVADARVDGAGGIEAWRKIGAAHRLAALEAEAARRGTATTAAQQ